LALSLTVGVARVLANVHYPADIFGGAVLGILTAFAVEKIHPKRFFRK
jgi:membrane-associated phospholipid phosphatase